MFTLGLLQFALGFFFSSWAPLTVIIDKLQQERADVLTLAFARAACAACATDLAARYDHRSVR